MSQLWSKIMGSKTIVWERGHIPTLSSTKSSPKPAISPPSSASAIEKSHALSQKDASQEGQAEHILLASLLEGKSDRMCPPAKYETDFDVMATSWFSLPTYYEFEGTLEEGIGIACQT